MSPRKTAGVFLLAGLAIVSAAEADEAAERRNGLNATLRGITKLEKRLGPERAQVLSSGARNLLQLAKRVDGLLPDEEVVAELGRSGERPEPPALTNLGTAGVRVRRVSDPATDFNLSQLSGFTQSETSTAWCGENVVVGFNDSGSYWESWIALRGPSLNGRARSTNHGRSFVDLGYLNPGPDSQNVLAGDPVVACSSEEDFAYASLFFFWDAFSTRQSAVSVSRSSDGGLTFADPVPAVAKPFFEGHLLDKPWLAVSPKDPQTMYVTYTDFDVSGTSASCGFVERIAIEIVRSTDGGLTWTAPLVLEEGCGPFFLAVQSSQVVVDHQGHVVVAWEHLDDIFTRDIRVARSMDGGATFGPPSVVSPVTCVGGCSVPELKGGFRSGLESPSLAVDRSSGPTRGRLYLAWHDGRRVKVSDFESQTRLYNFADIVISRSNDGGETWSAPAQVNTLDGRTDQYQPGIAVDGEGRLGACYYDRQLDPANLFVGRSCAFSRDGGETWRERRVTRGAWRPVHATDALMVPEYMGDYDTLAADSAPSSRRRGFLGSFSRQDKYGNPDVFANRLRF